MLVSGNRLTYEILDDHLYTVFEMLTHPDVSGKLVEQCIIDSKIVFWNFWAITAGTSIISKLFDL